MADIARAPMNTFRSRGTLPAAKVRPQDSQWDALAFIVVEDLGHRFNI